MKYRVLWDPDAFHALRTAWKAAKQPEAGIRAFDEIEQILGVDAHEQGESRVGDQRILLAPPIGVIFRAKPEIGEVLILEAWMFSRRSK